ncbi:SPOR domain-containing protein [Roseomonas sp. 18066]|uniref:SPOR domain-containing protein n=1 Tax=Roseomonas sp. 18066 TaxID=2681412 RepID=UPI001F277696|nr:SPOR domain-containing protein [Roseomonas sp. 18066]
MAIIAGGLAGVLAVGGIVGWAVSKLGNTTIPVIEADARPMKIRPEDRGGLRVANQDEIIFERRVAGSGFEPTGRLAPAAETPNLDALRAATAPPPAPATPVPTPAPAATPAPQAAAPHAATPHAAALATQNNARPQAPPPPAAQLAAPQAPAAPAAPPAPVGRIAPPAAPATPAPVPSRAGTVTVQLGALDSEAGARAEWDRLSKRVPELIGGRSPQITRFEREGKPTMWRLRLGGFEHDAAGSFCETVKSRGGACAVLGG